MSAPFAFLYRSHAWNSGLEAFWAVVILCVVSPLAGSEPVWRLGLIGLKLSIIYWERRNQELPFLRGVHGCSPHWGRLRRSRTRPIGIVTIDSTDLGNKAPAWSPFELHDDIHRIANVGLDRFIWQVNTALEEATGETRQALPG